MNQTYNDDSSIRYFDMERPDGTFVRTVYDQQNPEAYVTAELYETSDNTVHVKGWRRFCDRLARSREEGREYYT